MARNGLGGYPDQIVDGEGAAGHHKHAEPVSFRSEQGWNGTPASLPGISASSATAGAYSPVRSVISTCRYVDRDKNTSLFATRRASAAARETSGRSYGACAMLSTAVPTYRDMPTLRWSMIWRRIVASAETLILFVEP